jgi:NAD(P)-dependent dehydrogenase (short-subunit alcohol dehydrogenase family)
MGADSSTLGKKSTAKDVVEAYGEGQYLKGKIAIVTGGNSGIGLETCKALASAGCKVIMCSRSVKAGEDAIEKELMQNGEGGYALTEDARKLVSVSQLDLNSLASVQSFTNSILKDKKIKLDYLILNAGIMAVQERQETVDGFEKQVGVNHFGHAFLVDNLYAKFTSEAKSRGADCRVVCLTSSAHSMGTCRPENLHYENGRQYAAWGAYGQSKLCNLLYAKGLEKRFRDDGFAECCTSIGVHPGVIKTPLWRNTAFSSNFIVSFIGDLVIMAKTIPQGAATTVYATLATEAKEDSFRGAYLVDCAKETPTNGAEDPELCQKLWDATFEQLREKSSKL